MQQSNQTIYIPQTREDLSQLGNPDGDRYFNNGVGKHYHPLATRINFPSSPHNPAWHKYKMPWLHGKSFTYVGTSNIITDQELDDICKDSNVVGKTYYHKLTDELDELESQQSSVKSRKEKRKLNGRIKKVSQKIQKHLIYLLLSAIKTLVAKVEFIILSRVQNLNISLFLKLQRDAFINVYAVY